MADATELKKTTASEPMAAMAQPKNGAGEDTSATARLGAPPAPEAEGAAEGLRMEPMAVIPDEMAISYDDMLELLKKKSGIRVGRNDPILMLLPFLNAFLQLEVKIVNKHHEALTNTMSKKTQGFVDNVHEMVDNLEQAISSKTIESLNRVLENNLKAMEDYNKHLKLFSLFVVVGMIFQIGILFGLAIGLFSLGKG